MRQAGDAAAGTLAAMVQPFAWPLIDEHREAGRQLVMATTTPYDLVKPLADWLGFDDVIATRYGVNADGTFDGSLVGPFVWATRQARRRPRVGRGQRHRPRRELRLLRQRVRHPAAIGRRQPGRRQPGPEHGRDGDAAALADPTPRRVAGRVQDPGAGHRAADASCSSSPDPELMPYVRFDIDGVDNIPDHGPAIVVMQPPQLLRRRRGVDHHRPQRAERCASSARRRCSTPRSSGSSPRRWAASASSGRAVRASRCRRRPQPSRRASSWRWRPRGRSRAVRPSSTRCSRVGGAPPGCIS